MLRYREMQMFQAFVNFKVLFVTVCSGCIRKGMGSNPIFVIYEFRRRWKVLTYIHQKVRLQNHIVHDLAAFPRQTKQFSRLCPRSFKSSSCRVIASETQSVWQVLVPPVTQTTGFLIHRKLWFVKLIIANQRGKVAFRKSRATPFSLIIFTNFVYGGDIWFSPKRPGFGFW